MRRKMRYVPRSRTRALLNSCALIAVTVYALPRLPQLHPGLPGSFAALWICFAGLAIAANLYFLVGADAERSRMLEAQELRTAAHEAEIPGAEPGRRRAL
ncbi:MAG: hypothetical protein K6T30_04115 [Alicyclobacillus sp.]|nr:hypothetical protein [Alicyclobacillus sp.]